MNIKIFWLLEKPEQTVNINIEIFLKNKKIYSHCEDVVSDSYTKIHVDDLLIKDSYWLKISRKGTLGIGKTVLENYVTIDKIVIDDFWELSSDNFQSITTYDSEYKKLSIENGATWEVQKEYHNNVLFFCGDISTEIKTPVRNMFWQ